MIRFLETLTLFSRSLEIRLSKFDQKMLVCTRSREPTDGFRPNLVSCIIWTGKKLYYFWWPWPYFQGHHMTHTVKNEPCLLSIWKPSWWILTKLAWLHYWERGKKWLGFDDLDLIFKAAYALRMSNFDQKHFVCTLSPEPIDGFRPNLVSCIIGMVKMLD